ncbi:TRAP transporter substrate-binding protein [Kiritimatiella glycovorans]|uniref:TRAP-type C4-dicarboxylate transport system, periplasmic component n=1 Tax=Kiritimatiella glycovorans TaxID=1307763 RepID=A0A0G3ENC4_9BACT|nr:TRAP transporter substrate-binding protein [Kiritimatiella glycovorans]AKJ65649.1 TRAP-type C4-dicarboxylate transport system, periplasmic component [Kiritimatiella glycovorans]
MNKSASLFTGGFLLGALLASVMFSFVLRGKLSGGGAQGRTQTVLKLAHCLSTEHPVHQAMEYMKTHLEEISDGRMTVDIYPGSVLGSETQCIEMLQNGSLAMTKTSAAAMENFIPAMAVFGLPYIFRDADHYWKVLNGDIGRALLRKGETRFLYGLCYYDAGSRNFYSRGSPIRTPEDLEGLKIRVMNSETAIDMVKALGGAPTPIAWGELYSALAQGTVDGAENNPPSFISNRHYEVCKHFSLNGHTRIPDILMMSTRARDKLTPQQREWVQQAADASSEFQRALWKKETVAALKKAREEGVNIYTVDTAVFAARVQPMLRQVENPEVRELLDRIPEVH